MSLYTSLSPETRALVDIWEEEAFKFGLARDDHNRAALVIARQDALDAIRSDFLRAVMDSDEATATGREG